MQPANLQPLLNRIVSLESTLQKAMASMRPITVQVTRGNEVKPTRAVQIANR